MATSDLAVRSLKEGAADFIVKPWHLRPFEVIKDLLDKMRYNKQVKNTAYRIKKSPIKTSVS